MGWGCQGEEELGDGGGGGVEALQSPLSWGDTRVQGLRMLNLLFAPLPPQGSLGTPPNPLTQHPQTKCRVLSEVGLGTGGLTQTPKQSS